MPKLYAWAHGMSEGEALAFGHLFPGLGLVLNHRNVGVAEHLSIPPLVDVRSVPTARKVAELARAGARFRAVLVHDERNATGASGPYMTPAAYERAFGLIRDELGLSVPVHTMGLMPVGGWLRTTLRCRLFDEAYHALLPAADGRAFNPNKVRLPEVRRVLDVHRGPWVLSPAPFRGWFDRLVSPVGVRGWAELSDRPDVLAVALWCVREHVGVGGRWQVEHGLVDRWGDLTVVGLDVLRALEAGA